MKKTTFSLLSLFFALCFSFSGFSQFNFVHITDLHVCDNTPQGNTGNFDMNGEMFKCCLKQFNSLNPKPAFVVASGDISNIGMIGSTDGMYNALTSHLFPSPLSNPSPGAYFIDSALTIPIYFTVGNHEYYKKIVLPDIRTVPQYYAENVAPDSDYAITYNNAIFLFLRTDGDRPIWQDPSPLEGESKGITSEQCIWLRNTLITAGNKRKIIVMHHPPVNVAGTLIDGSPFTSSIAGLDDGSFLYNRETFMNICDSNQVDIVLAGHIHQNVVANRSGNVVNNNWSDGTRYIQTCEEFHGGYRVITVNSSSISVADHQQVDCATANILSLSNTSYNISPNPFNTDAILQISTNTEIKNYELIIFDLSGREVKRISNINVEKTVINRGTLAPGMYFYNISNSTNIIGTGKIIIN